MFSKGFIILALTVAANAAAINTAPIKLSLRVVRRFNLTGTVNILEHDQARARQMKLRASSGSTLWSRASVINTVATNQAFFYTTVIEAGSPLQSYNVIIDTASSNTWVGAASACPSGCQSTGDTVSVQYGSASFSGNEILCNINVGPGLAVSSQSMGCATSSTGFAPWDGVLGIGPDDLTQGTLSPDTSSSIPTVIDSAFSQGITPADKIGVLFEPTNTSSVTNGELSWGGIDSTKITGPLSCVGVTTTSPSTFYWGINESITYGATTILSTTAGIVDSGTTLILIASDAFSRYKSATGATSGGSTGLLSITPTQYATLQPLNFNIGGVTYILTRNGQIWPRSLNGLIGGIPGRIYLVVSDTGSPSGQGLDFIDGYTFLERFYSVYDTTNNEVCFATTPFTTANTN